MGCRCESHGAIVFAHRMSAARGPARASLALLAALAMALLVPGAALAQRAASALPSKPEIVPPVPLSELSAAYPEQGNGDAVVVLTLTVEPDGSVSGVSASQTQEPFSSQAVQAAQAFRFRPATRDGVAVRARIRVEIRFHSPLPEVAEPDPPPVIARDAVSAPEKLRAPRVVEIEVRGVKVDPSRTASLSRAEVRQIPGAFGDPFRAIEIMPGVTPIISGLPFFFVRGAPPGNVGYFLDGIRVPLLFHIGVGPSVVHPGLVDRVDLYPGGYPARYGRFSGGIVAGETTPAGSDLQGEYNVRFFDAGGLLRVPFAEHRGELLLAGRHAFTAALFSLLSPQTKLDYWDYQLRASYSPSPMHSFSVFSLGSYDFLGERTSTRVLTLFGTEFHRVEARYDRLLAQHGKLRLAVSAGLDRSQLPDDRFVRDRSLGARSEVSFQLFPEAMLRFGSDVTTDSYDVQVDTTELGPAAARAAGLFPTRTDLASGLRADLVLSVTPRFQIIPGARLDYFSSGGESAVAVDPRLSTRLELTRRLSLLSTFGLAHQPPAFVVPVPGFQPGGLRGGLQLAVQQSAGLDYDLGSGTSLTATVFHNGFFNMSDPIGATQREAGGCVPGTFPNDTLAGDRGSDPGPGRAGACGTPRFPPGTVGPDRSGGSGQGADGGGTTTAANALAARTNGEAYGLELFLKRRLTSRVGGFLSYTLSRSLRSFADRKFVAAFDRTHVFNGALAYDLGRNWRAGARVTFYTGLPKPPDPTQPHSTRLPPFFKLDLRVEKRWQLGSRAYLSAIAEWMNVTLSKEAISTTCTLNGCETRTIGPITIPSLGIEGGF
jgi:TonB family protein